MDYNNKIMNKVKEQMKKDASLPPTVNCVINDIEVDANSISLNDKVTDGYKEMFDLKEGTFRELLYKHKFLLSVAKYNRAECMCGSDVSFGKCHRKVMVDGERIIKRIKADYLKPHLITSKKAVNVKYSSYFSNLPNDVCEELNDYLINNKVKRQCCWFTSHRVASLVKDVKVVNGWWGTQYPSAMKSVFKSSNVFKPKKKLNNQYTYGIMDGLGTYSEQAIMDWDNMIVWARHSWNKYKGITFDLTSEMWSEMQVELVEHNKIKKVIDMGLMVNYLTDKSGKRWKHYMEYETFDVEELSTVPFNEGWSKEDTAKLSEQLTEGAMNTNLYYEGEDLSKHLSTQLDNLSVQRGL